jgi:hypothetical protein
MNMPPNCKTQSFSSSKGPRAAVEIWLDVLSLRSCFGVYSIVRKQDVSCVYYFNSTKNIGRFLPLIEKILGVNFIQFRDFDYGRTFIDDSSLNEKIEQKLRRIIDDLIAEWETEPVVTDFLDASGFDAELSTRHLGRLAWRYLWRPVELSIVSKAFSDADRIILLRRSPMSDLITKALQNTVFRFYSPAMFSWSYIPRAYHSIDLDMTMMRTYCGGPLRQMARTVRFMFEAFGSVFHPPQRITDTDSKPGIAVLRSIPFPFSFDALNDMYWWPKSDIDPKSIVIITEIISLSEDDRRAARQYGFRLLHLKRLFSGKQKRQPSKPGDEVAIAPGLILNYRELRALFRALMWAWKSESRPENWVRFNLAIFELHSRNRARLFERLGVRIIWHMDDMLGDGPFNHQAIRLCNGLSAGSHFSNHFYNVPQVEHLEDIVFPWGEFYHRTFFNRHKHLDVVPAGFYLDYNLRQKKSSFQDASPNLRDNFTISYLDQGMYADCYLSPESHTEIWTALIDILEELPSVVLIWKPKRNSVVETITKQVPRLGAMISEGRITVLLGKSDTIKTAPSAAAMVSNLAIAAFFSTAGIECWLAGTPTLFIDLSKLTRHFLPESAHNRIVFDDLNSLKDTIRDYVSDSQPDDLRFSGEFADEFDPYRDGHAYRRTGLYLRLLQQELSERPAMDAVAIARKRYDCALAAGFPSNTAALKERLEAEPFSENPAQN